METESLFSLVFIAGDICECRNIEDCEWSSRANNEIKKISNESEEFENIQFELERHSCGKKSVYCCGDDEKPPENIKPPIGMYLNIIFSLGMPL